MEFISHDLVRLTQAEIDAVKTFERYSLDRESNTCVNGVHNGMAGLSKQFEYTVPALDIIPGLKLAVLLHRGAVAAAPLAGVLMHLISETLDHGASIINEGDRERGAALALRNFEVDPDKVVADVARIHDLGWVMRRLREMEGQHDFASMSAEDVDGLHADDLLDWSRVLRESLDVVDSEIVSREITGLTGGIVDDDFLTGAEERSARKPARAKRTKAKTPKAKRTRK